MDIPTVVIICAVGLLIACVLGIWIDDYFGEF